MPISCTDLKDFALQLAVAGSDETKLRAAVSRAYYASFHSLLPLVAALPDSARCPPAATHVTHEEMSQRLSEWRVDSVFPSLSRLTTTKGQVRKALDASRALRVVADYRLTESITLGEAQSQVERARQIIRAVSQFNAEIEASSDVA